MVKIYKLICPISNEIRYVGKTTQTLSARLSVHLSCKSKCHRTSWITSLKNKGFKPLIQLIEEVEDSIWAEKEIYWIKYHKDIGCNLCNHTLGGEGQRGVKFSEETKQKMSNSRKGFKPKPESILKQKESIKNRVITDEWKKNMSKSANNKGSNNGNTKLTEDIVIQIKKRLLTNSAMEVANEFNLTYTIVWKIKKSQTWKNV